MTDRARLEQALIAADKAGDAEAAKKLALALRNHQEPQAQQPAKPYDPMNDAPRLPGEAGFDDPSIRPLSDAYDSLGKRVERFGRTVNAAAGQLNRAEGSAALGALDAVGSVVRGVVAAPVGAVVGTRKGGSPEEEARIADEFVRKYSSPFTEQGRAQIAMLGALASPLTESGTDVALGPLFAAESRTLAAGPAKIPSNARRATAGGSDVPAQPVAVGGAQSASRAAPERAAPAERQTQLGSVRPETDVEVAPDLVLETQARPNPDTKQKVAEARAKSFAQSIGIDWQSLNQGLRDSLTAIASDAKNLSKLDPEAVKRQVQLQSLPVPVPATRGVVTRDPVQLRNESNVAATEAGRQIRETHLDANEALLQNLEVLKGRVANRQGAAQTPEQVGISVQDQALRAKLELKKKEVSEKYKAAEAAGELQGKVSPARLIQTIRNSPDVSHFGWVESWLSKNEVIKKTEGGTVTQKLTLKQLEDLRQAAVARAMNGGTEGYYAGKVIKAIDDTTEGAGGKLYKEARKSRREQAMEFEETGAVARLVENKSRTDRATALENTWRQTVIGGSIQDLRNVKRSLLTGGDAKTRTAGRRAWRDIKAQTIQHIQNEATKSVALNERGQPNITPAAMKRAVDSIGADKLNEIFGPGTATRIERILEATRTVKTVPPQIHQGSSTMGNVLAFLERGLNKVPVVGDVGAGAIRAGVKLKEMGQAGRVVRESQDLPLKPPRRNKLADY